MLCVSGAVVLGSAVRLPPPPKWIWRISSQTNCCLRDGLKRDLLRFLSTNWSERVWGAFHFLCSVFTSWDSASPQHFAQPHFAGCSVQGWVWSKVWLEAERRSLYVDQGSFILKKIYSAHHSDCPLLQLLHCCSSSVQPLSQTLGFSSCLFKNSAPCSDWPANPLCCDWSIDSNLSLHLGFVRSRLNDVFPGNRVRRVSIGVFSHLVGVSEVSPNQQRRVSKPCCFKCRGDGLWGLFSVSETGWGGFSLSSSSFSLLLPPPPSSSPSSTSEAGDPWTTPLITRELDSSEQPETLAPAPSWELLSIREMSASIVWLLRWEIKGEAGGLKEEKMKGLRSPADKIIFVSYFEICSSNISWDNLLPRS